MTILITGGAGFIGSRLALRLLEAGETVVLYDNFNDYYDAGIKRGNVAVLQTAGGSRLHVIEGDIRDQDAVEAVFAAHPIQRIAHLAAMSNVRYSVERGRLYADVNTSGSVVMMDVARKFGVQVLVIGSTSSVYGNAETVPFREQDAPDFPLAPYPASKRAAELFAHSYHHLFGLNINVLRFFNVYGPHGRPDMMPIRTIRAILDDQPITIWDGGLLERDWTYIDDTLDGIIAALHTPMGFEILNLGCGAPVTLLAFIEHYERLIGKRAILRDEPAPPTEPRITYCDNTRARERLGFAPKIDLATGLAQTWAWYQARFLS